VRGTAGARLGEERLKDSDEDVEAEDERHRKLC